MDKHTAAELIAKLDAMLKEHGLPDDAQMAGNVGRFMWQSQVTACRNQIQHGIGTYYGEHEKLTEAQIGRRLRRKEKHAQSEWDQARAFVTLLQWRRAIKADVWFSLAS